MQCQVTHVHLEDIPYIHVLVDNSVGESPKLKLGRGILLTIPAPHLVLDRHDLPRSMPSTRLVKLFGVFWDIQRLCKFEYS